MTNLPIQVDSSVASVSQYDLANDEGPQVGLYQFSLQATPFPFVVHRGANKVNILEFPVTYPDDYIARSVFGKSFDEVVSIWEKNFDEVYSQGGVMVVQMHPWIEDPDSSGTDISQMAALITYMKSKTGVYFASMADANSRYRATYGV
jgi:hypothetical protein